jgi:hypothetical protein
MIRSVRLALLLLAASCTSAQSENIQRAIERWWMAYEECRGSSIPMERNPNCQTTRTLTTQLKNAGLCFGRPFSEAGSDFRKRWRVCEQSPGETVSLRDGRKIVLDRFQCENIERSSLLKRVCHDPNKNQAVIYVNTSYYIYCRVTDIAIEDMFNSTSMGRFFNQNFRNQREC